MKQLTPNDAFMLYAEGPDSPNHIGSLGIFDPSTAPGGTVTFEQMVEYYSARMHLGKAFRRRMVRVPFDLDDPWWVEDGSFDLEYHLRHTALPTPGDWAQLCKLLGRLHSRPLDLTRPPWEAYLIEGLNAVPGVPEGSIGILVRVHHTAIDGVGGIELMSALFQLGPDDPPPDVTDTWHPDRMPNSWELLGRAAIANATKPVRLVRGAARVLPKAVRIPGRLRSKEIQLPTLTVPTTRFNARVSPHRVFDGVTMQLADLKAIKGTVAGATVNDVVLTTCAGALRTYLGKLGELPEASLAAAVPMSLRTEGEAGDEGNRVAQLFIDLHTDIADPRPAGGRGGDHPHRQGQPAGPGGARPAADVPGDARCPLRAGVAGQRRDRSADRHHRHAQHPDQQHPRPPHPAVLRRRQVVAHVRLGPRRDRGRAHPHHHELLRSGDVLVYLGPRPHPGSVRVRRRAVGLVWRVAGGHRRRLKVGVGDGGGRRLPRPRSRPGRRLGHRPGTARRPAPCTGSVTTRRCRRRVA